jgi:uncharacterized membrane protein YbhN (UPF0104 family)
MRRALRWSLGACVIAVAALLLARQLQAVTWSALSAAWHDTPAAAIGMSLGCVAASFACLGGYEVFAARRATGRLVPARSAFAIGLVSHALSNTLGFPLVTGTAFRLRAYRSYALSGVQLTALLARVAACVALGVALVGAPALLATIARGSPAAWIGLAVCATGALYLLSRPRRDRWLGRVGRLVRELLPMAPVAVVEMLAMVAACWFLWPAALQLHPAHFVLLFVAATLAGLAAHAPGGIGVFEAAMLTAAPAGHAGAVLAALLLYRALYNLLPFALAAIAAPAVLADRRLRDDRRAQLDGG